MKNQQSLKVFLSSLIALIVLGISARMLAAEATQNALTVLASGHNRFYGSVLHDSDIITVGYGKERDSESLDFLSLRINGEGKLDKSFGRICNPVLAYTEYFTLSIKS